MKQLKEKSMIIQDLDEFDIPKNKGSRIENHSTYENEQENAQALDLILETNGIASTLIQGDSWNHSQYGSNECKGRFRTPLSEKHSNIKINVFLTFFV